ncbi:MAG TPA: hypothetical protein VKU79_05060 [Thermoplasmataceae archaeon]|nr:hypothetical protein [Thermoplasmataceae archaeon]
MIVNKDQVVQWLSGGDDKSGKLTDMPWNIRDYGEILVLDSARVPFSVFMVFENSIMRIFMKTGLETAVIENRPRLAIYRILLLLNRQLDLVKFMLDEINEEIVSRVDLELDALTREDLNEGLNMLLSSLFLMVHALHLEDEFKARVSERMILMVRDMLAHGKKHDEIRSFLTDKMGISDKEAESLLRQFIMTDGSNSLSEMYG